MGFQFYLSYLLFSFILCHQCLQNGGHQIIGINYSKLRYLKSLIKCFVNDMDLYYLKCGQNSKRWLYSMVPIFSYFVFISNQRVKLTLRDSSTGPVLGVLPNNHQFEFPQGYLPKAKPCVYRGTRASRVLRVPLGLVEVRVSMECWPGHPRLLKKKKTCKVHLQWEHAKCK